VGGLDAAAVSVLFSFSQAVSPSVGALLAPVVDVVSGREDQDQDCVFLSYSRADREFASQLHAALSSANRHLWVDWEDIPPSAEWLAEICLHIELSFAFIFVISPDSAASEICRTEIAHAAKHHKRIVPIVRRDADAKAVPDAVARLNWIFLRETDDFATGLQSVVAALHTDLEWARAHTRLLVRAIEWEGRGRDESFLLRGKDLDESEQWLGRHGSRQPEPTELQEAFVLESLIIQDRERAHVRGIGSRQVAAEAVTCLPHRLDLALLLSVEAYRIHPTPEALSSLLTALQENPHLAGFAGADYASWICMTLSARGDLLATSAWNKGITLWDVTAARPISPPLTGPGIDAVSLAFSPNGEVLAAAGRRGIALWDVAQCLVSGHPQSQPLADVTIGQCVAFRPDGEVLASGHADGSIVLWSLASRRQLGEPLLLEGAERSEVRSLAFSPDGTRLASATKGAVALWDGLDGIAVRTLLTGHGEEVHSLAFSPSGGLLLAVGGEGQSGITQSSDRITAWDVATRQHKTTSLFREDGHLLSVAVSPNGEMVAVGHEAGHVTILKVPNVKHRGLWADDFAEVIRLVGHTNNVVGLAFRSNGRMVSAGRDGKIIFWNIVSRHRLGRPLGSQTAVVTSLAFSPDGQTLATGSTKGHVLLWDVAGHRLIDKQITIGEREIEYLAFSRDGGVLVALESRRIVLWDTVNHCPIQDYPTDLPRDISKLALSRSGMLALGRADGSILLWDVRERRSLGDPLVCPSEGISALAFSMDGTLLASASYGVGSPITLWELTTRRPVDLPLSDHRGNIAPIGFTQKGDVLVSASGESYNRTITLWDVVNRQQLSQRVTTRANIETFACSPSGTTLALGGADGSLVFWDIAGRQPLGKPFAAHDGAVTSLAFTSDGRTLASGSARGRDLQGGGLMMWDVNVSSWQSRACGIANRNLSEDEWSRYLGQEPYRRTCPDVPESR